MLEVLMFFKPAKLSFILIGLLFTHSAFAVIDCTDKENRDKEECQKISKLAPLENTDLENTSIEGIKFKSKEDEEEFKATVAESDEKATQELVNNDLDQFLQDQNLKDQEIDTNILPDKITDDVDVFSILPVYQTERNFSGPGIKIDAVYTKTVK